MVKNLPAVREIWFWSLGQEDPLEKGMVTDSSILAWIIPWTEKPGGLQIWTEIRTCQLYPPWSTVLVHRTCFSGLSLQFEKRMVGGMGEACKRPPDPDEHPYGPISFLSLTPFSCWEPRSYRLLQFIILSNFLLPSASRPPRTILKAPWSKRRLNLCFEGIHLRGSELVLYSLQNFPIQKSFLLKTSTYGSCNQAHLKDFLPFFSQGLQHSYFL